MKIGLIKEAFEGCEPDVEAMVKKATNSLIQKGATVEEISVPMHKQGNIFLFLIQIQ